MDKEVLINIDEKNIEVNGFVTGFIKETIIGMLSSLKTDDSLNEFETIEIKINNKK